MYNTWCLLVESDGGVIGWKVWLVSSEGDSEERLALGCVFEWRRWLVGWIVLVFPRRAWRNGSAFDSRSKGWVFESPCPHLFSFPCDRMDKKTIADELTRFCATFHFDNGDFDGFCKSLALSIPL